MRSETVGERAIWGLMENFRIQGMQNAEVTKDENWRFSDSLLLLMKGDR